MSVNGKPRPIAVSIETVAMVNSSESMKSGEITHWFPGTER